jgi:hypothetical protein
MDALDKIYPSQIERARKIVKLYHFDYCPYSSLELIKQYFKDKIEEIEDFYIQDYKLIDVFPQYLSDGSKVYKGSFEITYLSIERELFKLGY